MRAVADASDRAGTDILDSTLLPLYREAFEMIFARRNMCRAAVTAAIFSVLLVGTSYPAVNAQAGALAVKTQAPGYYRMMLGKFEITALSDGAAPMPLDKLLTNTTPEQLTGLLKRNFLSAQVETSINAFLVNTGEQLILIDTGAGKLFGPVIAGRLIANIRKAGYEPNQIDRVLLTHIHTDHSGGLVIDGTASFPNATIHVAQQELEFWLNAENASKVAEGERKVFAQTKAAFAPYLERGKVKTFNGNAELFSGVSAVMTPGHTPGHSFYSIESEGQKLQFWGDLVHAADVQFAAPGVTIRFDVDAQAAAQQRVAAFADAARQGYWVAAPHISFPGIGHVRADGNAFTWIPANYSMDGLKP